MWRPFGLTVISREKHQEVSVGMCHQYDVGRAILGYVNRNLSRWRVNSTF